MTILRLLAFCILLFSTSPLYANDFYIHGSFPTTGSAATSSGMRAELDLITAGFDKMPALTGNASRAVIVNDSGTALSLTTGTLTLPGNLTFSGANNVVFATTGDTNITLPTSGTLLISGGNLGSATLAGGTLTGTTTNSGTLSGGAISSASISGGTISGVTLSGLTIDGSANTISNINLASQVTGITPVANGGTGLATMTAHALYVGNGTTAPNSIALGTTNTVLHGRTGIDPTFSAVVEGDLSLSDVTTGNGSSTAHGFIPKSPADSTKFLNGGATPAWSTVPGTLTAGTTVVQNPYATTTVTTQAHGLGGTPAFIVAYMECLTTEFGYSVGDRLYLNFGWAGGGSNGWYVEYDATNVRILSGGSLVGINKTTPAGAIALTSANWKVVVVPYKLN